jgi:vancomycin resistance protein YoaR
MVLDVSEQSMKEMKRGTSEFAACTLIKAGLCLLLPLFFLAFYSIDRPFSQTLVSKTVSLRGLSPQQILNIETAVQKLNHVVIAPDQEFSFNNIVGPRSAKHGYLPAPSYVGCFSSETLGGGICLVSSMVYQNALSCGMHITERVAHVRTTRAIQPGLDATVWYGGADLRFRNRLACPIEITTNYTPSEVTISFVGCVHSKDWQLTELSCCQRRDRRNQLSVLVFASQGGKTQLVSQDMYGIPITGVRKR